MRPFRYVFKTLPLFSVLIILMGGCTIRIGGYPLLPAFFLIPIYYWLIFRPDWLPLWSLFGIGLFYDSLMGYELGVSSLLLMMSSILGPYARPLISSLHFPLIWGAFGVYSLGYLILYGFFVSGGFPLVFSWVYGVVLYPPVAWVLSRLHIRLQAYG